jgi:hypothetical protein
LLIYLHFAFRLYLPGYNVTKNADLNIYVWNYPHKVHTLWENKNVDVKFSAHDTFLELPSSGTLKIERLESQIIKVLGANKLNKGPKHDSQNRLSSPMSEGGEP